MKNIVHEMNLLCINEEPFALATVMTRSGSAPRSTGAKMLVRQDGKIVGTVGGGILEAQVQQLASQMIAERCAAIRNFQFTGKDAATMDAICGGQMDVLVEYVNSADSGTAAMIHGLQTAVDNHRKAWLVTIMPHDKHSTTHVLIQSDGTVLGKLPVEIPLDTIMETRLPGQRELNQQQILVEPININGTAYIFGAGHVSRSLAEYTKAVGFWTVVLDDRDNYANSERFPTADELIVLDSFSDVMEKIQIDRDSYIVIVTRGHLNDRIVLAQALITGAGYIGMIGSRRKCDLIFQELRRIGFQNEDIQRVHAPIGLPIDAETPEEIGISIVSEMIQVRAKLRN